ncbi:GcvT family protein [Leucothrix pacifica]|uniref:FAD-dependent oxidoreductase n=1 Tax=Leucothrix pacifica TaxID=1247513 RepID=A0A317CR87_9GAMM|nr:FAD-dependent oxidoreductase [Leucothrix pacifica]PWR00698.1 FAD-dependent oxidoreductase [Leucothrix pacifica]
MSVNLPSHAQVVIVGGGVIGCSIAYHLTKLGWKDVVLLERKTLTCGTTWHAAGLVPQLRATYNMSMLAKYSTGLYESLEAETGQATGFKRNGSLTVATSMERMEELKHGASMARYCDFEVQVIEPEQAKEHWPLLNIDDLTGAVYLPGDGQTNPIDTTQALAKGAKMGGATIIEHCKVTDVFKENGKVTGVATEHGNISADYVVNCAGMWAREFGKLAGVNVPLHAAEHFYVVTEPMSDLGRNMPILRDPDGFNYYKEDAGKMLVGTFEPNAKPWGMDGIPDNFSFDELPEDYEHLEPYLEAAMHRIPSMGDVGLQVFFNGPESFTPDDRYHLGEAPELKNFFVAAGFNSVGIQSAGGAGKMLASWIVNGHAPTDLWDVDIRRNGKFQGNKNYLFDRTKEGLGLLYANHFPFRQYETARNVRKSILHDRLAAHGACFGEAAGWERANWFAPEGVTPEYEYSFGRQNWFEYNAAEHKAVRETVGLFDQTSFSKYLLQGPDACKVLNQICANNIDKPVDKITYTQWLNERGGIEADLTVTRIAEDQFLIVSGVETQTRDMDWLKKNIPADARAYASDVTSAYAVITLMGPNSRALISELTDADMSHAAFPFGSSREIDLAYAKVRASRLTYVGELGWELYVPTEFAPAVFDKIMEHGPTHGLKLCGYHTLNSLRMEKGYRHWGHDITDYDTPVEAGLTFAVSFKKPDGFIGKEALLKQQAEGVKKRLVQFLFEDPEPLCYHEEPIWRDGELVGRTTAGMFGHTLGATLAMGYVENEDGVTADWINAGSYEIEVAQKRYKVTANLGTFYDPENKKIRC